MKMRLGIKDFQSIRSAKLEFEPGITLITGPTMSGKTAIIRAVTDFIQNPKTAKRHIHWGAPAAVVAMKFDEGDTLVWKRTADTVAYSVGQQVYIKSGRSDIYDILPTFPFPLDVETHRPINITTEWDPLFPFDKSDSELFTMFEDIFSVAESSMVLDTIIQDQKNYKQEVEDIQKKKAATEAKVDAIDKALPLLKEAELELANKQLTALTTYLKSDDFKKADQAQAALKYKASKFSGDIPTIWAYEEIYKDYVQATALSKKLAIKVEKKQPETQVFDEYVDLVKDVSKAERLVSIASTRLPSVVPDTTIFEELHSLEVYTEAVERLREDSERVAGQIRDYQLQVEGYNKRLAEFKSCPLCNRPFSEGTCQK